MIEVMKHPRGNKDQKLMLEIEEERISGELKREISDLSQLKLDYWKESTYNSSKSSGGTPRLHSK